VPLAFVHRRRLRRTVFVGVTGSAAKTTTKDLIAAVLSTRGAVQKTPANSNFLLELARVVLATRPRHRFSVIEISAHLGPGSLDTPVALVRPKVAVVTNVGTDHFSVFRTREAVAAEKSKLVAALPADGIAVLNADDRRVSAMQPLCRGRVITFGTEPGATLRASDVRSAWPDRLSLTVTYEGHQVPVQTQLCGAHWTGAVLAALATGVALGVPIVESARALSGVLPFKGRMSPVVLPDGVTFIRDDYKASPATVDAAVDFLHSARAPRKLVVLGTLSDYPGDSGRRYVQVARRMREVADVVLLVGPWASSGLRAKRHPDDQTVQAFSSIREAANSLAASLRTGDLVLLKGSHRADHLERLILSRTMSVECWLSSCGKVGFCETCSQLRVPAEDIRADAAAIRPAGLGARLADGAPPAPPASLHVIIGLGNPEDEDRYHDSPHNLGKKVVNRIAAIIGLSWERGEAEALVVRGTWRGVTIHLVKPLVYMNESGPVIAELAARHGFSPAQCMLVHDDVALPPGVIRFREHGGDGGHRGVRSVIQTFQSDTFRRVKVGVGRPEDQRPLLDYLLTPLPAERLAVVDRACEDAARRILDSIGSE
jgi:UDP-N-acetylmuramoyl-tripeptide--D-alanyl-D-alanine ligase